MTSNVTNSRWGNVESEPKSASNSSVSAGAASAVLFQRSIPFGFEPNLPHLFGSRFRKVTAGLSLLESIDHGLSKSHFGIVVLSQDFFQNHWPKEELEELCIMDWRSEIAIPAGHKVTSEKFKEQSPTLAGRFAAKYGDGLEKVLQELREAMGLT